MNHISFPSLSWSIPTEHISKILLVGFVLWLNVSFIVQPGGLAFILFPQEYVEPMQFNGEQSEFDIEHFSSVTYEYESDGLIDNLRNAETTAEVGVGDCEDYAAVVASYWWGKGEDVQVVYLLDFDNIGDSNAAHVVTVHDGDIYSTGVIHEDMTLSEYAEYRGYDWYFVNDAPAP